MTYLMLCNYCGQEIDEDDHEVTISAEGIKVNDVGRWEKIDGYIGHYHGTECFARMRERISLVHAHSAVVAPIPTASPQRIGALRRKHRRDELKHDDQEGGE